MILNINCPDVLNFERIDLARQVSDWAKIFLEERYAHVVSWKKYGVFIVPPETHEIRLEPNAWRIFPGTCIHLPEDGELALYYTKFQKFPKLIVWKNNATNRTYNYRGISWAYQKTDLSRDLDGNFERSVVSKDINFVE